MTQKYVIDRENPSDGAQPTLEGIARSSASAPALASQHPRSGGGGPPEGWWRGRDTPIRRPSQLGDLHERGWAIAQARGRVFSPAFVSLAEPGAVAARGSIRARIASARAMPASAPALANSPAQNAPPMTALIPGTIGRRNPITMQARQVRIRKSAFAATLTTTRLA